MIAKSAEEALLDRLQSGDIGAVGAVVETYSRPLFAFILRMVGDYDMAEEIYQETWIRVVRYIGRFRREATFSTWLFRIALNLCRGALNRGRRREYVSLESVPDLSVTPGFDADSILQVQRLRRLLADLPDRMREALVLRYYHDKTEAEIAAIMDCAAGTVKSRLHRATGLLRKRMNVTIPNNNRTAKAGINLPGGSENFAPALA